MQKQNIATRFFVYFYSEHSERIYVKENKHNL